MSLLTNPHYFLFVAGVGVVMALLWQPASSHVGVTKPKSRPYLANDGDYYSKNCGGMWYQETMGGKCGICGDPWDKTRHNEVGGKFAKGVITGIYTQGQKITVEVFVSTNHKGYFQFKVCPSTRTKDPTQECFDNNVLKLADGSETKYKVKEEIGSGVTVKVELLLPNKLHCERCVLQMKYRAKNNWGGENANQEEFYNCSDITILEAKQ